MESRIQPTLGKEDLHLTGPDSQMGQLLRFFWHPIALSSDLRCESARPVRVLSEDLTLYRSRRGAPHLVGGRCAHRCTVLHTGIVEDEQIRCMYHGWRYNGDGLCTDIPAEKRERLNPVRIVGYPVHEYAGLVFAYLGEQPAPAFDLPRKSVLEDPSRHVFAKCEVWDCNWFQQVENSMDAVHLSFAHLWGIAGQFGSRISGGGEIPELAYSETSSGVRQVATRSNGNVRTSDWTFPNNNHVVAAGPHSEDPWAHISAWPVPVDDGHTMRFTLYSVEEADPAKLASLEAGYDLRYDPAHHKAALFRGDLSGISEPGLISAQDYVAVAGQGVICDRSKENLSASDAGIVFLRRVFLRELEALRLGGPTKQWTPLAEGVHLPSPPVRAAE